MVSPSLHLTFPENGGGAYYTVPTDDEVLSGQTELFYTTHRYLLGRSSSLTLKFCLSFFVNTNSPDLHSFCKQKYETSFTHLLVYFFRLVISIDLVLSEGRQFKIKNNTNGYVRTIYRRSGYNYSSNFCIQ